MKIVRRPDALGIVFGILAMAITAQLARPCRQHRIVRFGNGMIAMTLAAFRPVMIIESLLVFAAIKQARVGRVTQTAAAAHGCDSRWAGGVVSVTIITRRRTQVTAPEQGAAMRARTILRELIRRQGRPVRQRKTGHDRGISMAGAASFRHPLRINFRLRIFRGTNAVDAMTIYT